MKATIFYESDGGVASEVRSSPRFEPFEEFDGKKLVGVRLDEVLSVAGAEFQLVEIAAGGYFTMHTSPDEAFCQVVRGKGTLGLPDGCSIPYEGPELFVFRPGSLHEWRDVEGDTLLAVCLVKQG